MYHDIISINRWNKYYIRFIAGNSFINVEQILYNICTGELLLYTVWFLLELVLCGTNIQSHHECMILSTGVCNNHGTKLPKSVCILLHLV
jgi:hypothetical protein